MGSAKKCGKEGNDKCALAYSTAEHRAVLWIIANDPDTFNALESSDSGE